MSKARKRWCFKVISLWVSISFCFTAFAQELKLPPPTQMVGISATQSHPILRGVKINPDNPLQIEFVVDKQHEKSITKEEVNRLVSYFMAALTIPEEDLWVNLSPYEQDRIIPNELGQTAFGEGLLAQDYFLKQLASSLTYPESVSGKNYWQMVLRGQPQKAVNTFNKIWIVPQAAEIYENGNTALITEAKLKVMSEGDYLAQSQSKSKNSPADPKAEEALRQLVIPQIEKEVNSGENFSELRQIFCSYMLAKWFKNKLKDSLYKYYIDQKKIKGIDLTDKTIKEKIYNQYVEAFKKGVYNYVKADRVGTRFIASGGKITKRQYFSGGIQLPITPSITHDPAAAAAKMNEDGPFPKTVFDATGEGANSGKSRRGGPSGTTIVSTALVLGGTLTGSYFGVTVTTGCGSDTGAMPIQPDAAASQVLDAAALNDLKGELPGPSVDGSGVTPDAAVLPVDVPPAPVDISPASTDGKGAGDAPPFQLSVGDRLAANDYLKDLSALYDYAQKNFKSGIGYPANDGFVKLVNALMNANQTAAYGTGIVDQIRSVLTQNSQAALVIQSQFDLFSLAALAIELNKQAGDLLNGLYDTINQLADWKKNAPAGYVSDSDKEKILIVLATQYNVKISALFTNFPLLVTDPDFPYVLRLAFQVLGYMPIASDPLLVTLEAEYEAAKAQLGSQFTPANAMAVVAAKHPKNGAAIDLFAAYSPFSTFLIDQNGVIMNGATVISIPSGLLAAVDFTSSLVDVSVGPRYTVTPVDAGADGVKGIVDAGGGNMTLADTKEERAKIAQRADVIAAKLAWKKSLAAGTLPVQNKIVELPGADGKNLKISVSVVYVDKMPQGLRATTIRYRINSDGPIMQAIIVPSKKALIEALGTNAQTILAELKEAGITIEAVLSDREDHEGGEIHFMDHSVAWGAQIIKHRGELTPEQVLQRIERRSDKEWQARMAIEAKAGRAYQEGKVMEVFGDDTMVQGMTVRDMLAKNRESFGGVNLKAEIKTTGNSKAIELKLTPKLVEQFQRNGLRFAIVKFGYNITLQEMLNGR